MRIKDLLQVIPITVPVEIGLQSDNGPRTIRPSLFREEVLEQLGCLDKKVCLIRLDKQKDETVLRIVTED